MGKKRGKQGGRHWYQVHKRRAGNDSVKMSQKVRDADRQVKILEGELAILRTYRPDTISSWLRQFIFGKNDIDRKIDALSEKLNQARQALHAATSEARLAGERAYRADWADRNPDKARF